MFRPMAETVLFALAGATVIFRSPSSPRSWRLLPARQGLRERELPLPAGQAPLRAHARRSRSLTAPPSSPGPWCWSPSAASWPRRWEASSPLKLSEGTLAVQPARIPSIGLTTSLAMQRRGGAHAQGGVPGRDRSDVRAHGHGGDRDRSHGAERVRHVHHAPAPRGVEEGGKSQEELAAAIEKVLPTSLVRTTSSGSRSSCASMSSSPACAATWRSRSSAMTWTRC